MVVGFLFRYVRRCVLIVCIIVYYSKVLVLSTVKIKNTSNNAVLSYKLVAQSEADLAKGKISVDSPIGKGLLGKKVGDTTEISVPNGTVKFEILEITR